MVYTRVKPGSTGNNLSGEPEPTTSERERLILIPPTFYNSTVDTDAQHRLSHIRSAFDLTFSTFT